MMAKRTVLLSMIITVSLVARVPDDQEAISSPHEQAAPTLMGSWWPWGKAKKSTPKEAPKKRAKKKVALPTPPQEGDAYAWLSLYAKVAALLEEKSYRTIDIAKCVQNSLKAALSSIDAHSTFFSPDGFKLVLESTQGEFSGIGVSINGKEESDEGLGVVDVIEGGPAAKAGMHAGDRIVQVDGETLRGLSTDEVIGKLKGKTGTKVTIKVLRNKKQPLSFTITRDIIKDQTSMCYRFVEQDIYYLSLKIFNEIAAKQMEDLLVKANEGKCRGLILDLRRNPGGTMDSAIAMAGLFLEKNSLVVSTKNKKGKLIQEYRTTRDPLLKSDVPIFILIDNFTASASEILAGALKHHAEKNNGNHNLRVFLVGTTTFGKGSVQELVPVESGCAIKITTMLYYLPDDSSIQAKGIAPDFLIKPKAIPEEEMKWVNELYGKEAALKNHITVDEVEGKKDTAGKGEKKGFWKKLVGGSADDTTEASAADATVKASIADGDDADNDKKTPEEKQREALALDVQVQASVNMINFLNIARKADPTRTKTRRQALEFLKKNYLTDTITTVEKVK